MTAGGKPWAVILTVAVLSRLMSTDGRPMRSQQQQQQQLLERAGYQNPELDIDRTYELMNEKRSRNQHHSQHQQQQPAMTANNDGDDVGKAPHFGGGTQLVEQPASAADGRPVAGIPPAHVTTTARNVTKTDSVHSPEPKYHYEVHSVQHDPEKYATAERKLQAVVRQAAAAEHHLRAVDEDGVRQTLLDDSEHHNQRLLAARKTQVDKKEQHKTPSSSSSASTGRHRLEQLRHIEDEKDLLGEPDDEDEYGAYDYLQQQQQLAMAKDDVKPADKMAVEVRVDQNAASAAERPASAAAAAGDDRPAAAPQAVEEKHANNDDDNPVALPLQNVAGVHRDEGLAPGSASSIADIYFLAVVIGCSVAGIAGFLFAGLCWYRLQKKMKAASEVDYPAYGVTGPVTNASGPGKGSSNPLAGSPGDKKLAQNAQMYHFHHQKQQMIASERRGSDVNQHVGGTASDAESEEENEDGDYTVFECPGLATNGEMEVRNPMFNDPTPVGTPADVSGLYQQAKK